MHGLELLENLFIEAIEEKDNKSVKKYIQKGIDVNCEITSYGTTPLIAAASVNSNEIIELLLRAGAIIDKPDKDGWTPLIFAARLGNIKSMELLIEKGTNIKAKDKDGRTVAHHAMYDNTGKSIKCLTNFRAHFDYADNKGNYPISTAVQTENAFAVKELLKLGYYQFEAFYSSLYKEDIEIAKSFFPFVSDINEKHITGYTALITACKIGNYELIKLLLENGADPNITDNDNQTAIETLIKNNHLKCIGLFKADALVRKSDQLHIFKHRLPSLFQ